MRHDDTSIPVDDLAELDEVYLPFTVVYRNITEQVDYALLVFAESASFAADVADEFIEDQGIDGMVLNVSLMNVQATVIQKVEECQTSGTDELDDPIRKS